MNTQTMRNIREGRYFLGRQSWLRRGKLAVAVTLTALSLVGQWVSSTYAIPTTEQTPDQDPPCLRNLQVNSFTGTPATIDFGTSTTLSWKVTVPNGCTTLKLDIGGQTVNRQGSLTVQPLVNATYLLRATFLGRVRGIASTTVNVRLPAQVTINANNLVSLLRQALNTPNTTVVVENYVAMDLSYADSIPIAAGVTLKGGRTARVAGPRLYTTTRPGRLFQIQGDNVRITGLRIQGPDMGVADGDAKPKAIYINSNINIQIDHNELSGWSGAAVQVQDNYERIDYVLNPETVRIRDNYIHHNQHQGTHGYGVVIGDGAYALIERNVFDWNRHAIAGDGSDGSGYRAYRNLVLSHGGLHRWAFGTWIHTHQFDMHGQENCGIWDLVSDSLFNCGTAGHDMEIRYNSFFYTEDNAIKLRGTPQLKPYGAFVISNVFAHGSLGDAVVQEETGLFTSDNLTGVNGMNELGTCDFDGDGLNDSFLATGQTWWYSSGGNKPWVYLNTSLKRRSQVTLGFFNGDNICDVKVDGIIYPGGRSPLPVKPLLPPVNGGVLK